MRQYYRRSSMCHIASESHCKLFHADYGNCQCGSFYYWLFLVNDEVFTVEDVIETYCQNSVHTERGEDKFRIFGWFNHYIDVFVADGRLLPLSREASVLYSLKSV